MKVIQQSYEILTDLSNPIETILKPLERAGRICYKSENNITNDSCLTFCKNILNRGHEAVIEHSQLSVKFIVDRAIANELVRHRIASYCQESTRYVNYSKDKFGNEIKVIEPEDLLPRDSTNYNIWWMACKNAEEAYMAMLSNDVKPEIARNVLPLSTATEIIMTANIREFRSIMKLRTSTRAHPQMRSIMRKLLDEFKSKIPVLFDDIDVD
jgi:thymidylate synthase (FAD)